MLLLLQLYVFFFGIVFLFWILFFYFYLRIWWCAAGYMSCFFSFQLEVNVLIDVILVVFSSFGFVWFWSISSLHFWNWCPLLFFFPSFLIFASFWAGAAVYALDWLQFWTFAWFACVFSRWWRLLEYLLFVLLGYCMMVLWPMGQNTYYVDENKIMLLQCLNIVCYSG